MTAQFISAKTSLRFDHNILFTVLVFTKKISIFLFWWPRHLHFVVLILQTLRRLRAAWSSLTFKTPGSQTRPFLPGLRLRRAMIWIGLDFWPGKDAVFMFVGSLAAICVGAYPHTCRDLHRCVPSHCCSPHRPMPPKFILSLHMCKLREVYTSVGLYQRD